MLYLETEKEGFILPSVSATNGKYPPYLQVFLPLFVIRFTVTYLNEVFQNLKSNFIQIIYCFIFKG